MTAKTQPTKTSIYTKIVRHYSNRPIFCRNYVYGRNTKHLTDFLASDKGALKKEILANLTTEILEAGIDDMIEWQIKRAKQELKEAKQKEQQKKAYQTAIEAKSKRELESNILKDQLTEAQKKALSICYGVVI